jgi:hypothetical protein
VESLRSWTYQQLAVLQHSNGRPLLKLFGRHAEGPASQCAIFQFQVRQQEMQQQQQQRENYLAAASAASFRSLTGTLHVLLSISQCAIFQFQVR